MKSIRVIACLFAFAFAIAGAFASQAIDANETLVSAFGWDLDNQSGYPVHGNLFY